MLNFSKINIIFIYLIFLFISIFSLLNLQTNENIILDKKINLGLDLQGGSYLLLEINSDSLVEEKIQSKVIPLKKLLKDNNLTYSDFKISSKNLIFKNRDLSSSVKQLLSTSTNDFELTLYPKISMGDGQQANNPWLQEMPDPISRVSWDNYLTVSKSDAKDLGLKNINDSNGALNSNYASVSLEGKTIKVPVLIQPGQAKGSVGLSFGYGRSSGVKKELQTGVNGFEFYKNLVSTQSVKIESINETHEFACVQLHNTLMGRGDIIKETTLEIFNTKKSSTWNPVTQVSLNHIETPVSSPDVDLWQEFDRSIGHHFNLSIDLNACTGCGACVIACHTENNVPVVGKSEIRKSRDMHWLRIDRYYSSEDSFYEDDMKKDNISGLSS